MVGPLKSEQIALSFGNSIIIARVRARRMSQSSLFYNIIKPYFITVLATKLLVPSILVPEGYSFIRTNIGSRSQTPGVLRLL